MKDLPPPLQCILSSKFDCCYFRDMEQSTISQPSCMSLIAFRRQLTTLCYHSSFDDHQVHCTVPIILYSLCKVPLQRSDGCVTETNTFYIIHTHTYTHNHFIAVWTLSGTTRVSRYQKVHFAIFWIFWCKMKTTQAGAPTIRMDCHPSRLTGAPSLPSPPFLR